MSRVAGSFSRIVKPPGYHIVPKHDLHGLRHRLKGHAKKAHHFDLNLTAMVDMFSMLVMFLLMNFSSTGEVFFISKNVKIPDAAHGRQLESLPLISVSTSSIYFDAPAKPGQSPMQMEETGEDLPQLKLRLQQLRIMEQTLRPDKTFKGQINIQADEKVPLSQIKKVMNVLISEGWTGINFAVQSKKSAKPLPK